MSLNKSEGLRQVAKLRCRKLRKEQTPAEKTLWALLRNRRFLGLKFLRQFPIFYELDGRESFFIADFYCHELRLIIELDGTVHATQTREDALRDEILNFQGNTILRFENHVVFENQNTILSAIQALHKMRSTNPSPSPSLSEGCISHV